MIEERHQIYILYKKYTLFRNEKASAISNLVTEINRINSESYLIELSKSVFDETSESTENTTPQTTQANTNNVNDAGSWQYQSDMPNAGAGGYSIYTNSYSGYGNLFLPSTHYIINNL